MLPKGARHDELMALEKGADLGAAVTAAMEAIEQHFAPLSNQLLKDYGRFDNEVLESMMRTFDTEALRNASGDVIGRIYEYFIAEFPKQGAHDNGECCTPPSFVQTIVNVIEPNHGIVFDPACGSGGMFVQSSHFIERAGQDTMKRVTFYGHAKNETTARIAQINVAVNGLPRQHRGVVAWCQCGPAGQGRARCVARVGVALARGTADQGGGGVPVSAPTTGSTETKLTPSRRHAVQAWCEIAKALASSDEMADHELGRAVVDCARWLPGVRHKPPEKPPQRELPGLERTMPQKTRPEPGWER